MASRRLALLGSVVTFSSACSNELAPFSPSPSDVKYAAARSSERTLSFEGTVYFSSHAPTSELALQKINDQVAHLFGPFENMRPRAVPKKDHTISDVRLVIDGGGSGVHFANYRYTGTIVIEDAVRQNKFFAILPYRPDTIYEESVVDGAVPCTDQHYRSKVDFWYFWSPVRFGCKLKEGIHYFKAPVTLEDKGTRTRSSYPEYERLPQNGEVVASLFVGTDFSHTPWRPDMALDLNAKNFRLIREKLLALGFRSKGVWGEDEFLNLVRRHHSNPPTIAQIRNLVSSELPFVEEFVKSYSNDRGSTMRIKLFFGATGVAQRNKGFRYMFKEAIENEALVLYAGHSGLGGHLDLNLMEREEGFRISLNPLRYQIYFINSCSSYTYYTESYFSRKATASDPRGSRALDVLANGIGTYFDKLTSSSMALIGAVDDWLASGGRRSYQSLASAIDSDNLFGVSGDEDNPKN